MIEIRDGIYMDGSFSIRADFTLAAGSFTAVLGPSGAGKSTLLNIIAGFELLQSGSVEIDGLDVTLEPPASRAVSMVFQDNNVFAHLSAWKNVALGISPSLRLNEGQRASVDEALRRVDIGSLAERLPGEMSGGERQRIAIARTLVRKKPVLLLDEPFAALGPALRKDMLQLVRKLHDEKKLTTLMVTHAPADATTVADQVVFVDRGLVHEPFEVDSFFTSRSKAIRDYLG